MSEIEREWMEMENARENLPDHPRADTTAERRMILAGTTRTNDFRLDVEPAETFGREE